MMPVASFRRYGSTSKYVDTAEIFFFGVAYPCDKLHEQVQRGATTVSQDSGGKQTCTARRLTTRERGSTRACEYSAPVGVVCCVP